MAIEYGVQLGLAQSTQADQRINDLRYQNQLKKQASLEAAAKAKMFEDDTDYTNAMNVHDNPIVKEYATGVIKELGKFMNENPDWETNPQKRLQRKEILRRLKDNPDLNRGLMSDASYKQFQQDLATKSKDPNVFDQQAYDEVLQQWKNYERFGNQYATNEADALKLGKQAFVYQQPQDLVDYDGVGLKYGSDFHQMDVKPIKGGGSGSYQEVPNEQALTAIATDMYQRNKRTGDLRARQAGYSDPIEYTKSVIRAGIKTRFDYGDIAGDRAYTLAFSKAQGGQAPSGVWAKDVAGKNASYVNGDLLKSALGAKPSFKIKNGDGTHFIDLTGKEVDYTGRSVYLGDGKQKGIKNFEVITRLTPDEAREQKILSDNFLFDDDIESTWKDKAFLKTSKNNKGENVTYVEIRDFVPFDINSSTAAGIYDQKATTSKYVQSPSDSYQESISIVKRSPDGKYYQTSDGGIYDAQTNQRVK